MSNDPYKTGLVEIDNIDGDSNINWLGGLGHSYAYCINTPKELSEHHGAESCTDDKGFYNPNVCKHKDFWNMDNIMAWSATIGQYTGSFAYGIPETMHKDCGNVMGNKYGLNTGAKCRDRQGILQPKYTYIDNTTSELLAGSIPGTMHSASKIPVSSFNIGKSFFDDLTPDCRKVRLKYHLVDSTKQKEAKSDFTHPVHVANDEIKDIDESNYKEAFSNINTNSNTNIEKDILVLKLLLITILAIIILKLLNK